jgi:DNA replication protein DnaC
MGAATSAIRVVDSVTTTTDDKRPARPVLVSGSHAVVHIERGVAHCPRHGEYTYEARRAGSAVVGRVCPDCLVLGQAKAAQVNADIDERDRRRWLEERRRLSQLPEAFREATFDNYFPVCDLALAAKRTLLAYAESLETTLQSRPINGVVMNGNPGTGKTHLACALINCVINGGYSARYATVPGLLLSLQDSRTGQSNRSADAVLRDLIEPDLAVLDEYGVNTERDVDYQWLFALIDARYARNRPTVLVTNLNIKQLTKSVSERMLERVLGPYGAQIDMFWASQRKVQK